MKISHNGAEWHGTFAVVLVAMVDDLLSDGEPVKVAVSIEADEGGPVTFVRVLRLYDRATYRLHFEDGPSIDIEDVRSLEVL